MGNLSNTTIELEIQNTTDTKKSESCLDFHLETDNEYRLKHYVTSK